MASIRDRCETCGFDPRTVSPSDAVVAARSFPRRYRALLVRPDDDRADADVVRRSPPDGMSAFEHATVAAGAMRLAAAGVRQAALVDEPAVVFAVPPLPAYESVDVLLDRLTEAAEDLAAAVASYDPSEWDHRARGGDATVTALDLARHGVHQGVHHLREAERAVEQARGRA